jgi:hypothetical protein
LTRFREFSKQSLGPMSGPRTCEEIMKAVVWHDVDDRRVQTLRQPPRRVAENRRADGLSVVYCASWWESPALETHT